MVDCPKCQFNQPEDQFCANCGIDMLRYAQKYGRPKDSSFKPTLWGGVAVVALLLGIFVLTPLFNSAIFFGASDELSLEEERVESFGRFNLGSQREDHSLAAQEFGAPREVSSERQSAPIAQEEAASTPQTPTSLQINFALVPAEVVAKWIQESSDFSASGSTSSGVLPASTLSDSSSQIERLLSFSTEDLEQGLPFVTSLEELGLEAIGFNLDGEWDAGVLALEAVLMNAEEQGESSAPRWAERESVQRWTFDFKAGSPAFIVGLMPRPLAAPRTSPWNLPGLFDLWDSEDFVLGQKELVLIIAPGR